MKRFRQLTMTASVCAAIALSTMLTSSAHAQDAAERNTWYVFMDGDQPWGTSHIRVTPLPDGEVAYLTSTRLLTELLGMTQEMTTFSSVSVDPDLAPLWIETNVVQLSGSLRIEGEQTDAGFVLKIHQGDQVTTSTFSFGDELGLVASVALETWLHRLPDTTTKTRVRTLDVSSGSVREIDVELVERDEAVVTWRIYPGAIPGEMTVRLDADGVMVEQVHRYPPLHITRHPDASELQLVHRKFDDSELLMHPVDHPLPRLRQIQAITAQVTWRDVDPDVFNLEDSRQSLTALETVDGLTTAVVTLGRTSGVRTDCELPLTDDTFASSLGETDFIKPNDPEIIRTSREIVGDITSAREAAEAICMWTASFIESSMIAETLSGPEVLRRGVGKCTEFSTLYASLARAAGIPTRVALGQRIVPMDTGMHWVGHMWNEAWLGEWVPIDASAAEFGGSPALLKFVHSDTVMGTQDARWKLTESLTISVLDVTTLPDPGADDPTIVDGLHEGKWTSIAQGVRFRLPDESWRIEDVAPGTVLIRIRPATDDDPGDSAMIHFSAFDLPENVPPRIVIQSRLNTHRATLKSLEVLQDDAVIIADAAGHRITFQGEPDGAPPVKVTEFIWSSDGTGCLLNLISTLDLHDQYMPVLQSIADSFEFLNR